MKYSILDKLIYVKINTKLLDKINLKEVSTFAVRRIEFLYCLNEEIKRAIRLKSKINFRSLIDSYSVNKYTRKQIRRLLIQFFFRHS